VIRNSFTLLLITYYLSQKGENYVFIFREFCQESDGDNIRIVYIFAGRNGCFAKGGTLGGFSAFDDYDSFDNFGIGNDFD
jgi:hypothetical protein